MHGNEQCHDVVTSCMPLYSVTGGSSHRSLAHDGIIGTLADRSEPLSILLGSVACRRLVNVLTALMSTSDFTGARANSER